MVGRKTDFSIEGSTGESALPPVGLRFFRAFRRDDLGAVAVKEMRVLVQLFAPHDGRAIAVVVTLPVFEWGVTKADVYLSARLQECVTFKVNSRVAVVEHARRTVLARHQVFDADRANVGKTRFISSLQVLLRFHLTSLPFMEAYFTGSVNYVYRPVEPDTLGFCAISVSFCLRVFLINSIYNRVK